MKKITNILAACAVLTTSTTFAADEQPTNLADLALPYKGQIVGKIVVSHDVRKTANELTIGVRAKHEQARLLYNFVAQQIRPMTYSAGFVRSESSDAPTVLRNRFGDSQDRTVLFSALLKAKDIASTPALISGDNNFALPTAASLATPWTRTVTYLPDLDIFADVNTSNAAFGELPFVLAGKPALLLTSGQVKQTPLQTGEVASNAFNAAIQVNEDGSAFVKASSHMTGYEAINARRAFAGRDSVEIAAFQLARLKLNGAIVFDNDDTKKLNDGYTVRWQATFKNLLPLDKKSFVVPQLPVETDLAGYANALRSRKDVNTPWVCEGNKKQVSLLFTLPKTLTVAQLPPNVSVNADGITYLATYAFHNDVLSVDRVVTRAQPSHLCTAEQAQQWQAIAEAIDADLNASIVLH